MHGLRHVAAGRGRAGPGEGATGASSLADLVAKLAQAARGLADGAGRGRRTRRSPICCRCSKPGDTLIDGGNSYYVDDIRRAKELAAEADRLRRRRHQRRRLGSGARLLHDDRRPGGRRCSGSIRSSRTLAPGIGDIARTPGRARQTAAPPKHGYLHCGPNGAGHFVKMVHNGIEYGIMAAYAEGLGILKRGQRRQARARGRRRDDAAARPRALPVRPRPARHRRGLAARQRDRVVAARPDGGGAGRGSGARQVRRPRVRLRRRPLDDQGRDRRGRAGAGADHARCTSASPRAARPISRTSCCRRCASSSAATTRSRPTK